MPHSRRKFLSAVGAHCLASATRLMGMQSSIAAENSGLIVPQQADMHKNLVRIDEQMRTKGIHRDPTTGKMYFSGYSGKTLYDWDSYFEGIVQLELGWSPDFMVNAIQIFLDAQQPDGFVRRVNEPNRKNEDNEMAKPFLAQTALLISRKLGNTAWLEQKYYDRLRAFLEHWLMVLSKNGGKLSYWRSAPHTGMDTQRERAGLWMSDFDSGVDLNCYLYRECLAFALIADSKSKHDDTVWARSKAVEKKKAIQEMCWNERDGFYYDIDIRTNKQIAVKSIAGFTPLWALIATKSQARRLVEEHLVNSSEFWRKFPAPSLAATEKGYSESYLQGDIGSLWRATTWVPTNYCLMHGLASYGFRSIAKKIAEITYREVSSTGDYEYYLSDSEKGAGQYPFWGWTMLAYLMPWELQNRLDPTQLTLSGRVNYALEAR